MRRLNPEERCKSMFKLFRGELERGKYRRLAVARRCRDGMEESSTTLAAMDLQCRGDPV
jgi:hypothetical protein